LVKNRKKQEKLKMRKSTQIKTELDQTTKRLDELNAMQAGLTANLKTLQDGFISGKTSLDEVQTEQGKLTTLDSSIKVLETKRTELQTELQAAQDAENIKALIGNLKTIAEQAEAAFSEYDDLRVQFGEVMTETVEKLISKQAEYRGKRKEFKTIRDRIEAKAPDIKIGNELRAIGLDDKAFTTAVNDYPVFTPCKYGELVAIAEQRAVYEKQKKETDANRAKSNAERAERFAVLQAKAQAEKEVQRRQMEAAQERVIQYQRING
jgi:uncharacterized phage infection (PIP) family protein YhgE